MQRLPRDLEKLRVMHAALQRDRDALARKTEEFHQTVAYVHGERGRSYGEIASALNVTRARAHQLGQMGNA